jgi:choline dehydrogenase
MEAQMSDRSAVAAARIRANQEQLSANLDGQFDFIVCGAGTSGSVVAGRLAANPAVKVLLQSCRTRASERDD